MSTSDSLEEPANDIRGTDAAGRETGLESSRQQSTILHYNSFPGYNTVQYETSNGTETLPHMTAGGKHRTRVLGPDLLRGLLMMLMAMDHLAIALRSWEHGTGARSEEDGAVVTEWNYRTAYIVRTLTHLCGPGFTMLLGMGVVYLGHSRKQQGWGTGRLLRYFALRMVVLTLVMMINGTILTLGQVWFLNIVLFALAVNYFIAGVLWVLINKTEEMLTELLVRFLSDKEAARDEDSDSDAEQPLLRGGQPRIISVEVTAQRISWHVHNALLLILSFVTIFWNIWLSENNGRCVAETAQAPNAYSTILTSTAPEITADKYPWLTIWFWPTNSVGITSVFPPLAWVSFAIVGLLYGRIVITMPRASRSLVGHVGAGLFFTVIFVLTRLLHFGNLSENCLQTPENRAHPNMNQYLVSPAAFFYVVKYPPDVAFWSFTLGANFFLLAGFREISVAFAKRWLAMLLDFGTTALFFYIVHLPVAFVVGSTVAAVFGHDTGHPIPGELVPSRGIDNMFVFFAVWALCMLIMWPLCRWYGRFKATKPPDSLWRFF